MFGASGFYCVEDAARDLVSRIEAALAEETGPTGEPVAKETRRVEAEYLLARELKVIIERTQS